jgi:hypothetical protein
VFFAAEDCGTFVCPVVVGACCETNGFCSEITSNACAAIPGATFFLGQTCEVACPPDAGACCETNGFCSEISSNACAAIPGATFSPGLTCGDIVCDAGCGLRINGDYDGDGDVDLEDYAGYQRCIGESSSECLCPFDLDPNGMVDLADFVIFVMILSGDIDQSCVPFLDRIPADFHQDGKIDLRDFAALQVCFDVAENDECRCIFDINEDGEIDLEDLPAFIDLIVGP